MKGCTYTVRKKKRRVIFLFIGMLFHLSTKAFLLVRGWLGDSDAFLSFCQDRPTNALLATNLTVWWPFQWGDVIICQKNPNKLWPYVAGHCPTVNSADAAVQVCCTNAPANLSINNMHNCLFSLCQK